MICRSLALTTTSTTSPSFYTDVLVLNTFDASNVPMITDFNGKDNRDIAFVLGENTEVKHSCSMTWRGEHYVFGGDRQTKQVSKIVGCELRNIGWFRFKYC